MLQSRLDNRSVFLVITMSTSSSAEKRDYLGAQLCELEALESVYPKELKILDHGILADINEFVAGNRDDIPLRLEYSIAIDIPEGNVDMKVNLPVDYPLELPDVYVSSSSLNRTQQNRLNEALMEFLAVQERGEPCIYSLVTWLQDNLERYFRDSKKNGKNEINEGNKTEQNKNLEKKNVIFTRYWVYSHHIYSNMKRKDILEEAKENSLSGFCLPGKPGIICIEGAMDDCEYWWQKIKVMNWHKILIKFIEDEKMYNDDYNCLRKFSGFREIAFPSSDKHNDMGQLFKYLSEHESQHVFKELFGVEGKNALPT